MLSILSNIFGRKKTSSKSASHGFDPDVIKARIISHHMSNHPDSDQEVNLFGCHLEYDGGDKAVIAVPLVGGEPETAVFYSYDFSTGKIEVAAKT